MPKLKVYRTPIGFHDAYVAAPSMTSTNGVTLMSAIGARRPLARLEGRFIATLKPLPFKGGEHGAFHSHRLASSWRLSVVWNPSAKRISRASIRFTPWLKRL